MARLDPAAGGEAEGAAPLAGADPPVGTTASQAATTAPVAESPPGETDDGEESTVEEAGPLEVKRSPDEGEEGSTDEAAAPVADAAPPAGTAVFGGGSTATTVTERPEVPDRAETVTLVEWRAPPETGTVSIGRSPSSAAGCSSGGGRSIWGMAMVLQRAASAPGARAPALQYWPT